MVFHNYSVFKQSVFLRILIRVSSQTKGLERGWKRRARLGRDVLRLARFAHKTLTPRFTDIFTDFEKKKPRLFCSLGLMQLAMNTAIPAPLETEGFLSSSSPLPLAEAILNLFSELLSWQTNSFLVDFLSSTPSTSTISFRFSYLSRLQPFLLMYYPFRFRYWPSVRQRCPRFRHAVLWLHG